jgi:hypothetical protein
MIRHIASTEERERLADLERRSAAVLALCQDQGDQNEFIRRLHDDGFSIVESMYALMTVFGLPLSEVKPLVTAHPAWDRVVEQHEPLHDELERLFENETES